MNPKTICLFLSLIPLLFTNCSTVRSILYTAPGTLDYEKMFVCDTIKSISPQNTTTHNFFKTSDTYHLPKIQDWIPLSQRLGATDLKDFLAKSKTTSLIILHRDSVIFEWYSAKKEQNCPRILFSVSKSLTSMLAAVAQEEGLLHFDQKVADFIPEFGMDERRNITLRQLMNMTSGLDWKDSESMARLGRLYYNRNQKRFVINNSKQKYEAGTRYVYSSLSTQILGVCLEKAIGMNVAEYMQEKIWQPLELEHDAYMTLDSKAQNNSLTFCGFAVTARDLTRIGYMLLNDGTYKGQQILPKWFVEDVKQRNEDLSGYVYTYGFQRFGYEDKHYTSNQRFVAIGYKGQYLFVSPEHEMVIVRHGETEDSRWDYYMARLANLLIGKTNDLTDEQQDYTNELAGTYRSTDGHEMTFELDTQRDKYNRKTWTWTRDTKVFPIHKNLKSLPQMDGIGAGYESGSDKSRIFLDIVDDKAIGIYYFCSPSISMTYLNKVKD